MAWATLGDPDDARAVLREDPGLGVDHIDTSDNGGPRTLTPSIRSSSVDVQTRCMMPCRFAAPGARL